MVELSIVVVVPPTKTPAPSAEARLPKMELLRMTVLPPESKAPVATPAPKVAVFAEMVQVSRTEKPERLRPPPPPAEATLFLTWTRVRFICASWEGEPPGTTRRESRAPPEPPAVLATK